MTTANSTKRNNATGECIATLNGDAAATKEVAVIFENNRLGILADIRHDEKLYALTLNLKDTDGCQVITLGQDDEFRMTIDNKPYRQDEEVELFLQVSKADNRYVGVMKKAWMAPYDDTEKKEVFFSFYIKR